MRHNKHLLHSSLEIVQGDLHHWLPDTSFDWVISNPPYISTSAKLDQSIRFEPKLALLGGNSFYSRIFYIAHVAHAKHVLVEIGDEEQANFVVQLATEKNWDAVIWKDVAGLARAVYAHR